MLKISREDFRSLELKIQTEIKTIFLQFMEDLEKKTVKPDETVPAQEQWKPGHPRKLIPVEKTPAPAESKMHRMPKKLIDTNKILHGTSHTGTNPPENIIESDMTKIFRKKHRRGSH